ncbi:M3 family oligoendopeptidase [Planctomicrobium piriforme]|uniref:Oligoendopeptidase, pepF/M3 family n=1 Tax=Planctomicrobium piriforme TaxID=1576369 RepID=A0A1I3QH10_9PLAN|nr:M3 family oligoendopeptidase [Planctomicrobium piriforme]SFJ32647.1 oligoendopeptidase, pepF/M3 family [Planctomicrobium piriforme]
MTQTAAQKYSITWDLDSLYPRPDSVEFKVLIDGFKEDLKQLAAVSETLPAPSKSSAKVWGDFLEQVEKLFAYSCDLGAFVGCHTAADTENKAIQQIEGVLAATGPERNQVFTNLELALREISDEQLKEFAAADPRLKSLLFFLQDSRANAQFRLPKDLEMLSAELGVDGIHAWGRLFDRISGDLRIELMEKGEIVRKSPGQVRLDVLDRNTRVNNFYAIEKAWKKVEDTCADSLNHIAGTRLSRYKRLKTQDHLDAPLRFNRMQRKTLDTMWDVISQRKQVLLKFFERKAKLIGVERLAWYDQLAPLPQAASKGDTLTWDQACDTIIESFAEFSDELGDFAQKALDDRWVEAEDRSGKRQGGFCTGLPVRQQSRIFMTFTGSADSMSTLAHELGHAYHSHVLRSQPYLLQDYPMNLAETASTFAEAILGGKRLANAKTAGDKLGILNNMLTDSVAFLMNIHARFIFENQFHLERPAAELTADRLTEIMLAAQKEAYCDAFSEWSSVFWTSKLHFYISGLPFYNFPYTFGYLLSLGLYSTAGEFGKDFPKKYRELLLATGSMNAEEAVKSTLGYDLTKPDFWNRSIDVIDRHVAEFLKTSDEFVK